MTTTQPKILYFDNYFQWLSADF